MCRIVLENGNWKEEKEEEEKRRERFKEEGECSIDIIMIPTK